MNHLHFFVVGYYFQSVTDLRTGQIGHGLFPMTGPAQLFPMTTQC